MVPNSQAGGSYDPNLPSRRELWSQPPEREGAMIPNSQAGGSYGPNLPSGRELWSQTPKREGAMIPTSRAGGSYGPNLLSGRELWSQPPEREGAMIPNSRAGGSYGPNLPSGRELWSQTPKREGAMVPNSRAGGSYGGTPCHLLYKCLQHETRTTARKADSYHKMDVCHVCQRSVFMYVVKWLYSGVGGVGWGIIVTGMIFQQMYVRTYQVWYT